MINLNYTLGLFGSKRSTTGLSRRSITSTATAHRPHTHTLAFQKFRFFGTFFKFQFWSDKEASLPPQGRKGPVKTRQRGPLTFRFPHNRSFQASLLSHPLIEVFELGFRASRPLVNVNLRSAGSVCARARVCVCVCAAQLREWMRTRLPG